MLYVNLISTGWTKNDLLDAPVFCFYRGFTDVDIMCWPRTPTYDIKQVK